MECQYLNLSGLNPVRNTEYSRSLKFGKAQIIIQLYVRTCRRVLKTMRDSHISW